MIPDPNVALELGKSISLIEAEELEAPRKVHATHARLVTKFVPTPTRIRSSNNSHKLKGTRGSHEGSGSKPGVLDESTNIFSTSSEGTSVKPGIPNEEKDITEEKVILEWGDDQDSDYDDDANIYTENDDKDDDVDDEGNDDIKDAQDVDDEDAETESDTYEIYKYKIHVHKDVDVKIAEQETVKHEKKEKEEETDEAKPYAEKST
nr:hypothetical protein [Tanacetum cinerariifolium]